MGICADDWPVMAKVLTREPSELTVLSGGAEVAETGMPELKLIKGNPWL